LGGPNNRYAGTDPHSFHNIKRLDPAVDVLHWITDVKVDVRVLFASGISVAKEGDMENRACHFVSARWLFGLAMALLAASPALAQPLPPMNPPELVPTRPLPGSAEVPFSFDDAQPRPVVDPSTGPVPAAADSFNYSIGTDTARFEQSPFQLVQSGVSEDRPGQYRDTQYR
jgi:hypothetical protein